MRKKFFMENLIRMLLLSLLPVILVTTLFVAVLIPTEKKLLQEENHNKLSLIQENIELLLNDSNKVMNLLNIQSYANSIYQILESDSLDYIKFRTLNQTAAQLNAIVNSRSYIDSIYVYLTNSKKNYLTNSAHIYKLDGPVDTNWLSLCDGDSPYRLIRRQASLHPGIPTSQDYLTVIQENNKGHIVAVNIVVSYFKRLFQNLNLKPGEIIMFVDDGELLLSSSQNPLSDQILNSLDFSSHDQMPLYINGMLVFQTHSSDTGLDFISIIPEKEIYSNIRYLMTLAMAAMGICLVISILLSIRHAVNISSHLYSILDLMDAAISHQPLPDIQNHDNGLYSHIITNMIQTFTQRDFLQISLNEQRFQAMALELSALQYQINPHFLSNTLQMIDFEILRTVKHPSTANEMIQQLSRFLQYSLSSPNVDVSLEQEIQATRYYTALMSKRHSGQLEFFWEISEDVLDHPIPKLILQPMIENSIKHGLAGENQRLHISICAAPYDDGGLRLLVQDDGIGISPERLKELQTTLSDFRGFQETHIGLQNLFRRLQLRFSEAQCSIQLDGQPGHGFSVEILIHLLPP